MNLYAKLKEREGRPIRIGLIGAGKFAAMYLAQVPRTPGVRLVMIADLAPAGARANQLARRQHHRFAALRGGQSRYHGEQFAAVPGVAPMLAIVAEVESARAGSNPDFPRRAMPVDHHLCAIVELDLEQAGALRLQVGVGKAGLEGPLQRMQRGVGQGFEFAVGHLRPGIG